jgi:DNA-binding response OmpR family regulator
VPSASLGIPRASLRLVHPAADPAKLSRNHTEASGAVARILLIDDDDLLRPALAGLLERAGHVVQHASQADRAGRLFQEFKPELVITDILMPGTDGFEVIMMLRGLQPSVRILAISGGASRHNLGSSDVLTDASLLGAAATLAKPFSGAELLAVVDRVLASRR